MANKSLAIIAAISVVGIGFLVYQAATFETPQGTSTVEIEPPVARAPEPVQRAPAPEIPSVAETEVEIEEEPRPGLLTGRLPETVPPAEPIPELPPLNESDAFVLPRLAVFETGESLMRLLATEDLVRKFVVFADNVSEGNLPQLEYPVTGVSEEMKVQDVDTNLYVMDPESYHRFDEMIDTFVSVDINQGVALFGMMRPLFQEAYAELGYGERRFEEALIRAIDNVLEARTVEGPFELVKPSVMYLYAAQEIEDMSPVEKQLIRLGPENTAKLKARLAEYKTHLQMRR